MTHGARHAGVASVITLARTPLRAQITQDTLGWQHGSIASQAGVTSIIVFASTALFAGVVDANGVVLAGQARVTSTQNTFAVFGPGDATAGLAKTVDACVGIRITVFAHLACTTSRTGRTRRCANVVLTSELFAIAVGAAGVIETRAAFAACGTCGVLADAAITDELAVATAIGFTTTTFISIQTRACFAAGVRAQVATQSGVAAVVFGTRATVCANLACAHGTDALLANRACITTAVEVTSAVDSTGCTTFDLTPLDATFA